MAFNWFSVFHGLFLCSSFLIKAACLLRPSRDVSFYENENTSLSNVYCFTFAWTCCKAVHGSVCQLLSSQSENASGFVRVFYQQLVFAH